MIRIKTRLILGTVLGILGLAWAVLGTLPVVANTGNGAPSGPDYQLNIIGVENGTNLPSLSNTNRRTIFVALGKSGTVTSNIYLTPGADFRVCDGNAFDAVHNCDGTLANKATDGALFQLPCNTNVGTAGETIVPCSTLPSQDKLAYEVWARALGSPKLINGQPPQAKITTCATDTSTNTVVCSTENVVLMRVASKPTFKDVTNELTSLFISATNTRVELFAPGFEDFFWQYQNTGLRLAQIRFFFID